MSGNTTQGAALTRDNQSIENFAASIATGAVIFGIQMVAFLILSGNWKITRSAQSKENPTERQSLFHKIYYYKTAFVPKRKRIQEPTTAIESIKKVFTITDRELIRVAGVDGYLFLEYLQLLLRIFIPLGFVILPILLPVNHIGAVPGVSGLDSFAWPNVAVPSKVRRLWAHCILAVVVIVWVCYNAFQALRKFVRLRQTVLTTPEHRIRASATTILVQSIPRKWLTVAALDALYDVFPGGIKDIWINRNYDDLQEKVNRRTKIARALEAAETDLVIQCVKKHKKLEEKRLKEAGMKKSRAEKKQEEDAHNAQIAQAPLEEGVSSGNPHQIEQTLQQVLNDDSSSSSSSSRSSSPDSRRKRSKLPIPILGDGIQVVGDGFRDVGKMGQKMVGGFKGAFGGKREHERDRHHRPAQPDSPAQFDGPDDRPLSSPTSPKDFDRRPDSTDTYTPLHEPSKEMLEAELTNSAPNSPQSVGKAVKPTASTSKTNPLQIIKNSPINPLRRMSDFASPQPFRAEGEEFPLEVTGGDKRKYDFAGVYRGDLGDEDDQDALWRKYIKPKDRQTMRVPLFNKSWWPSLPLIGKKVDTIYYCRKELARLNHEIAEDQAHPENFPLMNSAFIQFNHQVAAHMACQSLSHHIPRHMTPRTVEVNPNYVLWDNLSMKWYMRYVRFFSVIVVIVGLIIFWGIPVSFTGALSQVHTLTQTLPWLKWLEDLPEWLLSFIQGVLPPALLAVLFVLLPIILRFLAEVTGVVTAGERELLVQNFYFAFVFIQLFLVVSISTGLTTAIERLSKDPLGVPQTLAQTLPRAANYFYSYMILQAFSISSGTLLQVGSVFILLFSRFLDTTPREKVSRVLSRPGINWGNMIPVYTNFGAIGIIYSVISPFITIMMLITFSLFWFTYRYQMIYVSYAKAETNGLIFPKAINQLFTGLYFLELCLIGLFFLQKDGRGNVTSFPQAIIMIIVLAFTAIFQVLLNQAFGTLFKYLPITFEDEAVQRDEEFQRAQASRWRQTDDEEHRSLTSELEDKEREERRESRRLEEDDKQNHRASRSYNAHESIEMKEIEEGHASAGRSRRKSSWADRSRSRSQSQSHHHKKKSWKKENPLDKLTEVMRGGIEDVTRPVRDIEAQILPSTNLFDDIDGTLEDIEPESRQKLIKRSFQHPATRAIQPAIWIPHDELGIAKDEIQRTGQRTDKVWITSVNARIDASGNVMYKGLPPDRDPFENIEV
ncbi:DUF221-domain-containing protein [Aaosphaeria arxii CBS 175.79]|uniref:DUF221-domain-containing protein n=1 Tax=Aaosphaeria arxii CBS 175.79 TaxID=1450172 RepID=A0A6A5XPZ2_9PLEO|nr:DUF221-domain-containing protein [Aaosphaeria arxii CBS 175.79]KAF2014907.1 DUF221-domain-containing protein [Aaosphaeria arxii CBS 175.79]